MTTIEDREAKRALWLRHWQAWSTAGESFAEYARRHQLEDDEGYRWKRILQRAVCTEAFNFSSFLMIATST